MTDYEKICDFENLYKSHGKCMKGKRHKSEAINYELNLEVLTPILQRRLIYDNAACQIGKGTHFAVKRLSGFMREHYRQHGTRGYFLKCDVRKYFASIDHEELKRRLAKVLPDKDIQRLLSYFIDTYHTPGRPGVGLPLGNQSSQWFAIYYLDPLDRFIKEVLGVKHYVRYMDDLILLHHDKDFLKDALVKINEMAENRLRLELNEKTQIFPLRSGMKFLGWHFYLTETGKVVRKLKAQTKTRYKRRMEKLQKDYATGAINMDDVENSLAGYNGHLMHGHTHRLKERVMKGFVLSRGD